MLSDRIAKILGGILFLFLCGLTIGCVAMAGISAKNGNSPGVIMFMIATMPCGFVTGALFVRLYLPQFADGFVDFLLAPKRWREKPAPLMGPVNALIKQQKYLAALDRVDQMLEESPEYPQLWLIRFDLFRQHLGLPEEALRTAEKYLVRPERMRSPVNVQLVLRYAELARELGLFDQAERQIDLELKRIGSGYSRHDRMLLVNMLDSIRAVKNGCTPAEECWKPPTPSTPAQ
ncbi:hypothetical protein [uncultured Victivallis sp.]|uniref:tetratricopeptide repeat protein n=1 Tax=uncultured Victivallis sp. TaxID=354118 RepID=UPI0025EFE142|nr:hypothetical protein [uncultured Victivallis sp.]